MANKRDYYEVLGVDRGATSQAIKSVYRKLAVEYHPDRNPGDSTSEERFKEAAEAYAVLSDAEKRARYDRFGHEGVSGGGFSGFDTETFGDFADILGEFFGFGLGDLFGGRRGRGGPRPGADLRYELPISLEEAAFGKEETLRIPRLESCDVCSGSGSKGNTAPSTCNACSGRGQIHVAQGFFAVARTCPQCRGEGRVVSDPCDDCGGEGRVRRERAIEVKIPAGVDSGNRLRLSGEGEHGRLGGRSGDLFVDIVVEPHERFRRDGPNVLSEMSVAYPQAVLGANLEAETLHGPAEFEIPPGTPYGAKFRIRGKGIERLDGRGRGDHIVYVSLFVPHPRELDDDQLELMRQLAESSGDVVHGERRVLDRVRDLFS